MGVEWSGVERDDERAEADRRARTRSSNYSAPDRAVRTPVDRERDEHLRPRSIQSFAAIIQRQTGGGKQRGIGS
jgi:hypothetical protein